MPRPAAPPALGGTPRLHAENLALDGYREAPRVQQADIRTAARQQGLDEFDTVAVGIVERDGKVSIIETA